MTNIKSKRWIFVAVAIVALFAATGVAAMHLAAQLLKTSIEQALGSGSRVAGLRVGLASIEITGLEVTAPDGWPTDTALRAERIVMVPSLRDLTSGHLLIDRITLQHAYISAIGPRQDGSLRILPGMLDQAGHNDRAEPVAHRRAHNATIGKVEFEDCSIELFDSAAAGSKSMRIDSFHGAIENVEVPQPNGETMQALKGLLKDFDSKGAIAVKAHISAGSGNPDIGQMAHNTERAR